MANRILNFNLDQVDDILDYYAELKQIPLAKVIYHATKDFVQGAYKVTPMGKKIPKNPFALIADRPHSDGRAFYIRLDDWGEATRKRLEKYRLATPPRGFARSQFINLFKTLEFKKVPHQVGRSSTEKIQRGFSFYAHPKKLTSRAQAVENWRQSDNMDTLKRLGLSEGHRAGNAAHPAYELTINEPSLDKFPNWEKEASAAGNKLAADRITVDFKKVFQRTHPNTLPDDPQ